MNHINDFDPEYTQNINHLKFLESESIHIIRETITETINPVMLYSIGKDSAVMLHLIRKAILQKPFFPLLHIDTTWKFQDMYNRDEKIKNIGMELIVHQNPEAVEKGINPLIMEHFTQN